MTAKWFAITGLDGSGKTTLKNNLIEHFSLNAYRVHGFKLPYDKHLLSLLDISGGGDPYKDAYTDRLIFAVDNRIVSNHITNWRKEYDLLISQRCFLDPFVFGTVQGFSYEEIFKINRINDLEKCDVLIHLNADPKVAYDRIKNDPNGDKFETQEFIFKQAQATQTVFQELEKGNIPYFESFNNIPQVYIDTTNITCEETFKRTLEFLNL